MSAPAWASDKLKASSRAVKHSRQHNHQDDVGDAPMYYSGPGSSSSLDLTATPAATTRAASAATTRGSANNNAVAQEAPYLTHVVRNAHGQLTLVPPDNLGRQRTAGTVDEHNTLAQQQPHKTPNKVKKARKQQQQSQQQHSSRQRKPDAAILDAVINAGRRSTATTSDEQQALGVGTSAAPPPPEPPILAPRPIARSRSSNRSLDTLASSSQASTTPSRTELAPISAPPLGTQIEPGSAAITEQASLAFPSSTQQIDSHASLVPALLDSPPPAYPAHTNDTRDNEAGHSRPTTPSLFELDEQPASNQDQQAPSNIDFPATTNIPLPTLNPETPPSPDLLTGPDPFSVAWEQDRLAGLDLEVRIGRDLARRKAASASNVISVSASVVDDLAGLDLTAQRVQTGEADLAQHTQDQYGEAARDGPRVARALSIYAGRKIALAAERRRAAEADLHTVRQTEAVVEEPEEAKASESEAMFHGALSGQSQQRQNDGALFNTIAEAETEEEESDDDITSSPARTVPVSAHRQFAEAAERRMAAMKTNPERAGTSPAEETARHEQGAGAERVSTEQRSATEPAVALETGERCDQDMPDTLNRQFTESSKPSGFLANASQHSSLSQGTLEEPRTELVLASTRSETPPPLSAPSLPGSSTPLPAVQQAASVRSSLTRSPAIGNIASFVSAPVLDSPASPSRSPTRPDRISSTHVSVEENMLPLRWTPPRALSPQQIPRMAEPAHPVGSSSPRRLPPPVPPSRVSSQMSASTQPVARQPLFSASDPELLKHSRSEHERVPLAPGVLTQSSTTQPLQRRPRPLPIPPSSSADVYGAPLSWTLSHGGSPRRDALSQLMGRQDDDDEEVARQRRQALDRLEGTVMRGRSVEADRESEAMQRTRSGASSIDELPEEPVRQFGSTTTSARPESTTRTVSTTNMQDTNSAETSRAESTDQAHATNIQAQELGQFTELDLLLARLERDQAGSNGAGDDGTNYDDLNLLGEVMGPAKPPGATQEELETLAVARVECERRRVDKYGKVKVKLSVVGVRCVDCGICLSRFKVDDLAVVLPNCLHAQVLPPTLRFFGLLAFIQTRKN
ncbi:hypothetical protein OIV83_001532 [Microbotryomycetes sp. JL201]|nr:hypothetical protein OIV83_001532 [Microbotryomycetes sp. JL201]